MSAAWLDLQHDLHVGTGVYFVLPQSLGLEQFGGLVEAFWRLGATVVGEGTRESHWRALQQRASGDMAWARVVPRYAGPNDTVEDIRRTRAAAQSFDNILAARGYMAFELDHLAYTLDLFNPADELGLAYLGAGEPVVLLLVRGQHPGVTQRELVRFPTFYQVLGAMDQILAPSHIRGEHSFAPIALAYLERRLPRQMRAWDLLFGLSVLNRALETLPDDLRRACTKLEAWPGDRTLVQVMPGLGARLAPEYVEAARLLGMTAVQELVPAGYTRRGRPVWADE